MHEPGGGKTFLVELYQGRHTASALERTAKRARAAAAELSAEGRPVRHLRLIFVPEDETCFHVFTGARAADVAETCHRAGIAYERILEAVGAPGRHTHQEEMT